MSTIDLLADTMAALRFEAASEAAAAVDAVVQLEECERRTGRPYVTLADRVRCGQALARWERLRVVA